MIHEKIIENAEGVLKLLNAGIFDKEEVRCMLGLEPKAPVERTILDI